MRNHELPELKAAHGSGKCKVAEIRFAPPTCHFIQEPEGDTLCGTVPRAHAPAFWPSSLQVLPPPSPLSNISEILLLKCPFGSRRRVTAWQHHSSAVVILLTFRFSLGEGFFVFRSKQGVRQQRKHLVSGILLLL